MFNVRYYHDHLLHSKICLKMSPFFFYIYVLCGLFTSSLYSQANVRGVALRAGALERGDQHRAPGAALHARHGEGLPALRQLLRKYQGDAATVRP